MLVYGTFRSIPPIRELVYVMKNQCLRFQHPPKSREEIQLISSLDQLEVKEETFNFLSSKRESWCK